MKQNDDVIFYNNHFIPNTAACISHHDRGFTYGDGLFETLLSYNYALPFFEEHWQRLSNSAELLNIRIPFNYSKDYILTRIHELLKKNFVAKNSWQIIKIIITRGENPPGVRSLVPVDNHSECNLLIQCFHCNAPVLKNKTLEISPYKVSQHSPVVQIKTLQYLDKIIAKQQAINNGYDDALLLNTADNILEATTSNIFFIDKHNQMTTPPVSDGLLPGITRQFVMNVAEELNFQTNIQSIDVEELGDYVAAFTTDAVNGLTEIKKINTKTLSSHPITAILFAHFVKRFEHHSM